MEVIQESLLLRTSSDSSTPTKAMLWGDALTRWPKSGRWELNGECWTRNSLEYPNGDAACSSSLSSILESQVKVKYFLSPKACRGILNRSERRGRPLPEVLRTALEAVAHATPTL